MFLKKLSWVESMVIYRTFKEEDFFIEHVVAEYNRTKFSMRYLNLRKSFFIAVDIWKRRKVFEIANKDFDGLTSSDIFFIVAKIAKNLR